MLRFVAATTICLGAAAAAILLTTRHLYTVQAERAAAGQARVLGEALLGAELRPSDVDAQVLGARRASLDDLLRRRVLDGGAALAVSVVRSDGVVTYSSDHRLIGSSVESDQGPGGAALTSRVEHVRSSAGSIKVLRSMVPIDVGGQRATIVIDQDYRSVETAAREAFLPVAGILEIVLVALLVLLLPLLVRVTRRLARQVERIRYQSTHDELTGLPNRVLFNQRLKSALAADTTVAVVLLDLNEFKAVNDTLGHATGDELLREVAERLRRVAGDSNLVARFGGDEFGVLAPGRSASEALEVAAQLRAALSTPLVVDGVPLAFEAGVGVAAGPADGAEAGILVQHAEIAMYAAKARHRGIVVYEPALDQSDRDSLGLVAELRSALDAGQIVLHYQPKTDLRTGALRGGEALVRWEHPERGLLPPGAFVPYAERTELMRPLTRRVLELAVAQTASWRGRGFAARVAVNVTTLDLVDESFPDEIAALLERHGLEQGALALELTESSMMSEPERVAAVLERLSAQGIEIAIDDFGTGYSSLAYLKTLPVHVLKIDRAFISDLATGGSDAIVRATIELAHALGLEVVAEGVETAAVSDQLRTLGCDVAQGYLIGRPMPAAELEAAFARPAAAA